MSQTSTAHSRLIRTGSAAAPWAAASTVGPPGGRALPPAPDHALISLGKIAKRECKVLVLGPNQEAHGRSGNGVHTLTSYYEQYPCGRSLHSVRDVRGNGFSSSDTEPTRKEERRETHGPSSTVWSNQLGLYFFEKMSSLPSSMETFSKIHSNCLHWSDLCNIIIILFI